MGVEPYLITASIKGVIAQRLVRTICPNCKTTSNTPKHLMERFKNVLPPSISQGAGCKRCNNTGYKGRVALFELLIPDDKIKEMIINRKSSTEIENYAQSKGLLLETLGENGLRLISEGLTTVDEVLIKTVV